MDPQDNNEILGSGVLNPLLIPDVIRTVLESRRLSVDDLKTCRRVCTDWSAHATAVLSHKSRITIKGTSGMKKFEETFITGQEIPTRDFKLVEYDCVGNMQDFMTHFSPLFDWPRLEIESLILKVNNNNWDSPYLCINNRIGDFLADLSTLLNKTGNLKHLAFQYWNFRFKICENLNTPEKVIQNGSKIKSLSINDCFLPHAAARILLPTFNTVFTELESIDFSNLKNHHYSFSTAIPAETLVKSFTSSNIKILRIPELNTEVIGRLNQTDLKVKHFHADVMTISDTSRDAWTEFLTQQNELESFSINNLYTEADCLVQIGYRIPRMEKLRRLHLGGRHGFWCVSERNQIFKTCPKLNELIADRLPVDMIFTNHQITSLTLDNPNVWYCGWFEDLTRVSKEYLGLKYLTVKVHRMMDRASVISALSNIFPNLLEFKVIP